MVKFETTLLSNVDIKELLTVEEVVDTVEKTWREDALGRIVNPPKLGLELGESDEWPQYNAFMNAMPAYVGWLDIAGLKWAGGFWNNASLNLPSIWGLILLIDPKKGAFRTVMEGSLITSLRTAAQSVVGIRHLARERFESIGIYGSGTQAGFHALLFSKFFPKKKIKFYDPRKDVAKNLAQKVSREYALDATACVEPQECSQADIIITLTTSKTPFVRPEWIRGGQLILALGSYQEILPDAIKKANKILVDQPQQTLHRGALRILADKGEITEKDIHATIGEVIAGLKTGRENSDELIFFEPVGTGMLDVAVAAVAYKKSVEKNIGQKFEFFKE